MKSKMYKPAYYVSSMKYQNKVYFYIFQIENVDNSLQTIQNNLGVPIFIVTHITLHKVI